MKKHVYIKKQTAMMRDDIFMECVKFHLVMDSMVKYKALISNENVF